MKSWSVNKVLFIMLFLGMGTALASVADGLACLDRYDLSCAQSEAKTALGDAGTLLKAKLAFSLGNFSEATDLMGGLESSLGSNEAYKENFKSDLELYRRTLSATADFTTETQGDISLSYLPGVDKIMVAEVFETLSAARSNIGARLGGAPPEGIRMELYPSLQRFTDASSLPASAVRTTGVIALSKWTRLLVTSPRALGRGYAWKDTVAHEYTHYIVAWRTQDRAPVWLQEGIARSMEMLWQPGASFSLAPQAQSLLAEALLTDSFIPLEKMHPSIAFLDSARDAALAYAQVSTMMVYLQQVAGPDAISQVLDRVREGEDALVAVAAVGAGGDEAAFMEGWKQMLRGMNLVQRKLEAMPPAVDPGQSAYDADPVLAQRHDLANLTRLGELLAQRGHPEAALVEYGKAVPQDEPPSPLLSARMAESLLALGRRDAARTLLMTSVQDYPEYAITRTALADLLAKDGKLQDALAQYRASADINPFDPHVQGALADLYTATAQPNLAERHAGYRRLLEAGGVTTETR